MSLEITCLRRQGTFCGNAAAGHRLYAEFAAEPAETAKRYSKGLTGFLIASVDAGYAFDPTPVHSFHGVLLIGYALDLDEHSSGHVDNLDSTITLSEWSLLILDPRMLQRCRSEPSKK